MSAAVEFARQAIEDGVFNEAIEGEIVKFVREGPDENLTEIGFILKMSVHLMDRSSPPISFTKGKQLAAAAYRTFLADEKLSFGVDGYDWTGVGARIIADQYEADYWEPHP